MLKYQVKAQAAKARLEDRLLDDTGSVIEELGFKGLMIGAAVLAGTTVAITVGLWAGAIPAP